MKKIFLTLILLAITSGVFSQQYDVNGYLEVNQKAVSAEVTSNPFADYDSLSTAIDTLSEMGGYSTVTSLYSQWFQIWAICDSAMLISTDISFPANKTRLVKGGESYTSPVYDVAVLNLYFKVKGTGKALLRREFWGK